MKDEDRGCERGYLFIHFTGVAAGDCCLGQEHIAAIKPFIVCLGPMLQYVPPDEKQGAVISFKKASDIIQPPVLAELYGSTLSTWSSSMPLTIAYHHISSYIS